MDKDAAWDKITHHNIQNTESYYLKLKNTSEKKKAERSKSNLWKDSSKPLWDDSFPQKLT